MEEPKSLKIIVDEGDDQELVFKNVLETELTEYEETTKWSGFFWDKVYTKI